MIAARPVDQRRVAVRRPQRRAFTLVEMMIVIGVILLLAALTLTVTVTFTRRSEVRATESLLMQLDSTLGEWQLTASREITFGINGEPCPDDFTGPSDLRYPVYEIDQEHGAGFVWPDETDAYEDAHEITDAIWRVIGRSTVWREFITSVDPEMVEIHESEEPGEPDAHHFLDAWGTQILAIHPGRPFKRGCDDRAATGYIPDDDGTIRTPYEWRYGIAVGRRMFFVSAGPDGKFGDLSAEPDSDEYRRTQDNIYSYEVIKP